jgi:hypothetical protein
VHFVQRKLGCLVGLAGEGWGVVVDCRAWLLTFVLQLLMLLLLLALMLLPLISPLLRRWCVRVACTSAG